MFIWAFGGANLQPQKPIRETRAFGFRNIAIDERDQEGSQMRL